MVDSDIKVGDIVRFVCNQMDEYGSMTNRIRKVTGKLIKIETTCSETNYPKYHVRRNGKDYWYSGDNLQIIKFKNQFNK